jgi:hypothetical protein
MRLTMRFIIRFAIYLKKTEKLLTRDLQLAARGRIFALKIQQGMTRESTMPPWVRYKYLKEDLGVVNDRVALARGDR